MGEETFGEYRVGLSFNPSQDPQVAKVKRLAAELIDEMEGVIRMDQHDNPEAQRCAGIAQEQFEQAAMWAVKAVTKRKR